MRIFVSLITLSALCATVSLPHRSVANPLVNRALRSSAKQLGKGITKPNRLRLNRLITRYGQRHAKTLRRGGPKLQSVLEDVTPAQGAKLMKTYQRLGDPALHVIQSPQTRQLIFKYGDDAADVLVKHTRTGARLLKSYGPEAAPALKGMTRQQAQRLHILTRRGKLSQVNKLSQSQRAQLWDQISKRSEQVLTWMERHPGQVISLAFLTALVTQPEATLSGVGRFVKHVGEGVLVPLLLPLVRYLSIAVLIFGVWRWRHRLWRSSASTTP